MKNDFTATYTSLTKSEKVAFKKYLDHFYAGNKTALQVFEHVAAKKDIDSLETITHRNSLNALSDLKKWLIEWLTVQEIQSNSYDVQWLTIEALRKRNLNELSESKSKHLSDELSKQSDNDIWHTLLGFRLGYADYFAAQGDKLKDNQAQKIQALMAKLDDFFLVMKLKLSIEIESRRQIRQEAYTPLLLNDLLGLLEAEVGKKDSSFHPLVKNLYLPLYKLIKFKSVEAYADLKTLLEEDATLDEGEKQDILLYLLNFTTFQVRQGDETYYQAFFDLAKIGIEKDFFMVGDYFSSTAFNNIINVAFHLKEDVWVQHFIETTSKHLHPEDRDIAKGLAMARLNFEQGLFQKTMDALNQMSHKNTHYSLQIRMLLARANYEQGILTSLQNDHCEAAEGFIARNKMDAVLKKEVSNFFKIMRFLIDYNPKKQTIKTQILKIHDTLTNKEEPIAFRAFLKQKFDALTS